MCMHQERERRTCNMPHLPVSVFIPHSISLFFYSFSNPFSIAQPTLLHHIKKLTKTEAHAVPLMENDIF